MPEYEKFKLIFKLGVKLIVRLNFKRIKNLDFEIFFKKILVEKLNAKLIVCGENLRFGKNKKGDVFALKSLAKKNNISVFAKKLLNFLDEPISSTRIRKALKEGNFKISRKMLDYWFYVKINVRRFIVKNNFITINKKINKKNLILSIGFYLALAKQKKIKSFAMIEIKELEDFKTLNVKFKFNKNFKLTNLKLIFIKKF